MGILKGALVRLGLFAGQVVTFAESDLPSFPTFDLGGIGKWFMNGMSSLFTSNIQWLILPGLAVAGIFGAIALIKRVGKGAVRG